MDMDWRQWSYLVYTVSLGVILYGLLVYLYGSTKRGEYIERTKDLIFTDDPMISIDDKSEFLEDDEKGKAA